MNYIDAKILEDLKSVVNGRGSGTYEGMAMLKLPNNHEVYYAANMYIVALNTIQKLMKELGIDNQLYE